MSSDASYSIPLHSGWNLISNPFNQSVTWSSVTSKNSITQPIWSYNGSYNQSSTFEPYQGYYYYNSTDLNSLKIPYTSILGKVSTGNYGDIIISLKRSGRVLDAINLKFDNLSKNELDEFDIYSPGDLYTDASINILHPEGNARANILKTDSRSVLGDGQEYLIKIKNENSDVLFLSVSNNKLDSPIYLIDDDLTNVEELIGDVNLHQLVKSKMYRLIIGKKEYVEQLKQEYLPKEFQIFQNYPNPFNPTTLIRFALPSKDNVLMEVYNILGEHVRTLVNNIVYEAGKYEIEFSAKDLASGVYLLRLKTSNKVKYIKMLLAK